MAAPFFCATLTLVRIRIRRKCLYECVKRNGLIVLMPFSVSLQVSPGSSVVFGFFVLRQFIFRGRFRRAMLCVVQEGCQHAPLCLGVTGPGGKGWKPNQRVVTNDGSLETNMTYHEAGSVSFLTDRWSTRVIARRRRRVMSCTCERNPGTDKTGNHLGLEAITGGLPSNMV